MHSQEPLSLTCTFTSVLIFRRTLAAAATAAAAVAAAGWHYLLPLMFQRLVLTGIGQGYPCALIWAGPTKTWETARVFVEGLELDDPHADGEL